MSGSCRLKIRSAEIHRRSSSFPPQPDKPYPHGMFRRAILLAAASLAACGVVRLVLPIDREGVLIPVEDGEEGWGYIDLRGRFVFEKRWAEQARNFRGKAAKIGDFSWDRLIDRNGNEIDFEESDVRYLGSGFSEPGWFVAIKVTETEEGNSTHYGMVDGSGKTVIPFEFERIGKWFFDDRLVVATKNGGTGMIDRSGKLVVPFEWDRIMKGFGFGERYPIVEKDGKRGLIDLEGNLLVPPEWPDIRMAGDRWAAVELGEGSWKQGLVDFEGKKLIPPEFSQVDVLEADDTAFAVVLKDDGKSALLDLAGNEVIPAHDSLLFPAGNGPYLVAVRPTEGDEDGSVWRYGVVDSRGKTKVEFESETLEQTGHKDLLFAKEGWEVQLNRPFQRRSGGATTMGCRGGSLKAFGLEIAGQRIAKFRLPPMAG